MGWIADLFRLLVGVIVPSVRKAYETPSPAEVRDAHDKALDEALDAASERPTRPVREDIYAEID